MFILYDIIFFIFAILSLPVMLIKGKWHPGMLMRFGSWSQSLCERFAEQESIWFHAVSVGEVLVSLGLIEKVREEYPGNRIVLSTVTRTGEQLARQKLREDDIVIYAPLDISFIVRKFIRIIRPRVYITAETEIWPNLFIALGQAHIPVIIVNGRISDKAFPRYKTIKFLLGPILKNVSRFCMQTENDRDKIVAMGADAARVQVTGNMKFDELNETGILSRCEMEMKEDDLVWVAGSTHRGEEEIVLDIFCNMKTEMPNLKLVLAPRHIERTKEVEALIKDREMSYKLFSQIDEGPVPGADVLLIDSIGRLKDLYALSDLVFVGKSLSAHGGQNIIEPAFSAKPIMVGPYMENFQKIKKIFLENNALIEVADAHDLAVHAALLLKNEEMRRQYGQAALAIVRQNQGSTEKNLQQIKILIP